MGIRKSPSAGFALATAVIAVVCFCAASVVFISLSLGQEYGVRKACCCECEK